MPKRARGVTGRPRVDPTDPDVKKIGDLAGEGYDLREIARGIGVGYSTLQRWQKEHEEVQTAIECGRAKERRVLHNVLFKAATEGSGKDALIAAMFLLKARHGYRDHGEIPDQAPRTTVTINLPAAAPLKDLVIENADGTEVKRLPTKAVVAAGRS